MSTKHFFHEYDGLVVRALKGFIACNPSLALNGPEKVIYNPSHSRSKVSIISGGGSGHEPAWSGYVGDGMLAAAVNGDIFGSPAAKQVLAGIESVPSDKGTILVITNYTGDKLHFGLACEKAKAYAGVENIAVMAITDDVALGRKRAGMVGRRGLAGNVLGLKILGAAAEEGLGFDECLSLGRVVNDNLVTIGASLDHCHVLGRINHEKIPEDVCVLGMGIHNEPGLQKLTPLPTPESLIMQMLACLLDLNDEDRAFVDFKLGDKVVLLVNNFGGTSTLELTALAGEATLQLNSKWGIKPIRTYCGAFETSLNGPGFSISLLNISGISQVSATEGKILDLLDSPTSAPAWPVTKWPTSKINTRGFQLNGRSDKIALTNGEVHMQVDPSMLEKVVRTGCQRAIDSEPDLTRWDMIMGDGDCGESVKAVCQAILKRLDNGLASSGSVQGVLNGIISCVDDMGGTLGAIFGIFLAAFAASLQRSTNGEGLSLILGHSLSAAINSLKSHSGARLGDRTVMDVLIPFCEIFAKNANFEEAVLVARKAAVGTANMQAKFGRATYVNGSGDMETTPPDPGAWAVKEMIEGMFDALQ